MSGQIGSLAARLRTLFAPGRMTLRLADGRAQVESHNGRVTEGREAFPYGFRARAKSGKALTLCQGGDPGGTVILPIVNDSDTGAPELKDGDAALYTGEGARVTLRESGAVEIEARKGGDFAAVGEAGKFYFGNDATNLCEVLCGLIDEIKALATFGSPNSQTVMPATQQKLELYKNTVKKLLKEGRDGDVRSGA